LLLSPDIFFDVSGAVIAVSEIIAIGAASDYNFTPLWRIAAATPVQRRKTTGVGRSYGTKIESFQSEWPSRSLKICNR
jgi:hypothetical protein